MINVQYGDSFTTVLTNFDIYPSVIVTEFYCFYVISEDVVLPPMMPLDCLGNHHHD